MTAARGMAGSSVPQAVERESISDDEFGAGRLITAESMLRALAIPTRGELFDLDPGRFNGMPRDPLSPPFQLVTYRTPHGIRVDSDIDYLRPDVNPSGTAWIDELMIGTVHCGAHIDALSHVTRGDADEWYNGYAAHDHLGDFGPTYGDAAKLPAMFTRGVLLDVAGWHGVPCMAKGQPITGGDLASAAQAQGVEVRPWDVVLIRTGYLSLWPDAEKMRAHLTPGPDITAAEWLRERGVIATGTDTETYEVQPAPPGPPGQPSNPQPVHTLLLIDHGIYLMESIYLEELARDQVYEFLFVAAPLKITGATGSMIDPLAVV